MIKYLSESVDCLALFSTHYHMLLDEFSASPRIAMYHMACHVDPLENQVTYLYKFTRGIANKSYGGHVALAAGLPQRIIQRANEMSESFEKRCIEAMGNKSMTHATGEGKCQLADCSVRRNTRAFIYLPLFSLCACLCRFFSV